MAAETTGQDFLSEANWQILIRQIQNRRVVPIIGPGMVTMDDGTTLNEWLAPRLAEALGLTGDGAPYTQLNQVACEFLVRNGARSQIYDMIRVMIDDLDRPKCQALRDLASISDFDLFVSTTFDPLLGEILEQTRPDFRSRSPEQAGAGATVFQYHPNLARDLPADPQMAKPSLFHILGDVNTYPDFAVWEEDYMEYLYSLIGHRDTLENFFRFLNQRYLLLLGAPFTDWTVRLFLRIAKGERLTERRAQMDYLADDPANLEDSMVFFFDQLVGTTHIVRGNPTAFVAELSRRWLERANKSAPKPETQFRWSGLPEQMPRDSIFISYASEDAPAAKRLAADLQDAGLPVWFDKRRLEAGDDFKTVLEAEVKHRCSFFISLISKTTELDPAGERYFHRERRWAAGRHVPGQTFYIPLIIEKIDGDQQAPVCEPGIFSGVHFESILGENDRERFVEHMCRRVRDFQESERR